MPSFFLNEALRTLTYASWRKKSHFHRGSSDRPCIFGIYFSTIRQVRQNLLSRRFTTRSTPRRNSVTEFIPKQGYSRRGGRRMELHLCPATKEGEAHKNRCTNISPDGMDRTTRIFPHGIGNRKRWRRRIRICCHWILTGPQIPVVHQEQRRM